MHRSVSLFHGAVDEVAARDRRAYRQTVLPNVIETVRLLSGAFRSRLREDVGKESGAVLVGRHLKQPRFCVLVADDFEPWRTYACSELKKCDGAYSIEQTADGLETVQKAHELQPDLILLDISLPKMHGIDAARQIRSKCPNSKILFVSEDRSLDIVREALSTGAQGYVVKSDGSELLAAIDAVRQGRFFVSKSLAKYSLVAAELDPGAK